MQRMSLAELRDVAVIYRVIWGRKGKNSGRYRKLYLDTINQIANREMEF